MPRSRGALYALLLLCLMFGGCVHGPVFIAPGQRKPIDRSIVDYPSDCTLEIVAEGLTGPIDCDIDPQGNLIIAESGTGGYEPHVFGCRQDGSTFNIYPPFRPIRVPFDLATLGYKIYGPIGGIAMDGNKVYVSHRDQDGMGTITAFAYDGSHSTIIAGIPAQGDNGLSDIAIKSSSGRLYFGVGTATNSGVVGLDNWSWVKKYPNFCDRSYVDLKLNGFQFKSKHPDAGIFGAPEIAVTAPFQPFNVSTPTRIRHSDLPNGAIYSVDVGGGNLKVEAYGIHCPRGLTFSLDALYMTNGGMELRGTRPIKDDPDVLLRVAFGWYGWPDYSADLKPITDERFQLRGEMLPLLTKSGYDEIGFLIDHSASNNGEGLLAPSPSLLLQATLPSLSGAGRFDFVPGNGPFAEYQGQVIIPLSGDRAPFATSGRKLVGTIGFKVVRVDPNKHEVQEFVRNAKLLPASRLKRGEGLIERPVAVKFAPDGSLYIVDFGKLDVKDNRIKVVPNTGRVFRLRPLPSTRPTSTVTQTN